MSNMNMLRDKIKDSGMPITFIARKIGISRESLYNKLNESVEFKASEICSIAKVLHLTMEERDGIFFDDSVI